MSSMYAIIVSYLELDVIKSSQPASHDAARAQLFAQQLTPDDT